MPFNAGIFRKSIAIFGQSFNTQNLTDGRFYPIQGGDFNGNVSEINAVFMIITEGRLKAIGLGISANTLSVDGSWHFRLNGGTAETITIPAGVVDVFIKQVDLLLPVKSQVNWLFNDNGATGTASISSASATVQET